MRMGHFQNGLISHRLPNRLVLAQDPSPRIIGVQALRGLRCSRCRRSGRS